jgi:hypothetical protein
LRDDDVKVGGSDVEIGDQVDVDLQVLGSDVLALASDVRDGMREVATGTSTAAGKQNANAVKTEKELEKRLRGVLIADPRIYAVSAAFRQPDDGAMSFAGETDLFLQVVCDRSQPVPLFPKRRVPEVAGHDVDSASYKFWNMEWFREAEKRRCALWSAVGPLNTFVRVSPPFRVSH